MINIPTIVVEVELEKELLEDFHSHAREAAAPAGVRAVEAAVP